MTRDRWIQLVAGVIALGGVVGSVLLLEPINKQRRDLQLSYDVEVGDQVEPQVALLTTVAGSFRGIIVDALWYRAEMEKRAGRLYEANALADWITTLQPRFPQVWAFNAWNMAYNISVKTHTPQERWDWVSKGVRLLRNKGIVYNPNAVQLYRELSWIWFHKIGGTTDDMNVYYKAKVAEKWQQLLGSPPGGAPTKAVLQWFKPIRDAADLYFTSELGRPGHEIQDLLDQLKAKVPDYSERVKRFKHMPVNRLREHLNALRRTAEDQQRADAAIQLLDRTIKRVAQADDRASTDRLVRLYNHSPKTKALVSKLRAMGYALNESTLRNIGRLEAMVQYGPFSRRSTKVMLSWAEQALKPADRHLLGLMLDPDNDQGWRALLPYLRAKVLVNDYHMDPATMYRMMDEFGPMDWRHPIAHAAYWGALGIEKSGELLDSTRVDVLNTDRRIIQSMQTLMHSGRVNYDPLAQTLQGRVSYQPDPRFIPAYEKALNHALGRIKAARGTDQAYSGGVPSQFRAGYENFLQTAVVYSYLYGNVKQARKYYREVGKKFGAAPGQTQVTRYDQPLDDFVMRQIMRNTGAKDFNRAFITSRIRAALTQGLANNRQDVFSRNIELARQAHEHYNKLRSNPTPNAKSQRLAFEPFPKLVTDVYVDYMKNGRIPLYRRSRVYQATPSMALLRKAFPRFREDVAKQIRQTNPNSNPSFLFPPPPGLQDQSKSQPNQDESQDQDHDQDQDQNQTQK